MTAKQLLDAFSETLMQDERILTPRERELLLSILQSSRTIADRPDVQSAVNAAISRSVGEAIAQRAFALLGGSIVEQILRRSNLVPDPVDDATTVTMAPQPPAKAPQPPAGPMGQPGAPQPPAGPQPPAISVYERGMADSVLRKDPQPPAGPMNQPGAPQPPAGPQPPAAFHHSGDERHMASAVSRKDPQPPAGPMNQPGAPQPPAGPQPPAMSNSFALDTSHDRTSHDGSSHDASGQQQAVGVLDMPAPARCIVLDEFLAPQELEELINYTLQNESEFRNSEIVSPAGDGWVDFDHRRSRVLMNLGKHERVILDRIRGVLPSVLDQLGMSEFAVTHTEAQITASNDGDFFGEHYDNSDERISSRRLTFVYFFHSEPRQFQGGELRLHDSRDNNRIHSYQAITPQQNQIVFFPCSVLHEITPVECRSQAFADSRFTLNGWLHK